MTEALGREFRDFGDGGLVECYMDHHWNAQRGNPAQWEQIVDLDDAWDRAFTYGYGADDDD